MTRRRFWGYALLSLLVTLFWLWWLFGNPVVPDRNDLLE
jgi:hypothetical protein